MEINTADEMMKAIEELIKAMSRPTRKQFYLWVKQKRKMYDFTHPLGGTNATATSIPAPVHVSDVFPDSTVEQNAAESSTKPAVEVSDNQC